MLPISRREFVALVGAGSAAAAASPLSRAQRRSAPPTAAGIIERIETHIGMDWRAGTVDGLKAGDPSTPVTGIATTSMATLAVLQAAVAAGANFVVTAQPTFYARGDARMPPSSDCIFDAKNDFIAKHGLVVFRLTDHWRQRTPDPFTEGLAASLGSAARLADDPRRFAIPAVTLDVLAASLKKALNARGGMRVIGDPRMRVQRVGLLPGTIAIQTTVATLPHVDVMIAGEVREWESSEYVRDAIHAGESKGLILLGRVVSDEPGMDVCASWMKTFALEVSVRHIPAGDPYWRPA